MNKTIVTPTWAQPLTIPVIMGIFFMGIGAMISPLFYDDNISVKVGTMIIGLGFTFFAKSMCKLIPFIKLEAYIDEEYLLTENKGINNKYLISDLTIIKHSILEYIEILDTDGKRIFCCDYKFQDAMKIVTDLQIKIKG
ncbi:MAG: hypothetical protein HRT88_17570 [Lentisphaeraceae bacterium]|nr:hypothetical protein [Lentisphaeraceae bacterium]